MRKTDGPCILLPICVAARSIHAPERLWLERRGMKLTESLGGLSPALSAGVEGRPCGPRALCPARRGEAPPGPHPSRGCPQSRGRLLGPSPRGASG